MTPIVAFVSLLSGIEMFGRPGFLGYVVAVNDQVVAHDKGFRCDQIAGKEIQAIAQSTAKALCVPVHEYMIDIDEPETFEAFCKTLKLDPNKLDPQQYDEVVAQLSEMSAETMLRLTAHLSCGYNKDFYNSVELSHYDEMAQWEEIDVNLNHKPSDRAFERFDVLCEFGLTLEAAAWHTDDVCEALEAAGFEANTDNLHIMHQEIRDRLGGSGEAFRDLIIQSIIWSSKDKLDHSTSDSHRKAA